MSTYRIEQLASDLADVLIALEVSGSVTLVGHSMGGMVALTYLGRVAPDRPVDPQGLVLVATAADRLAERGLGRLLSTPATAALVGIIDHTPEQALRVLAGPVCATLGRWYGYGRAQRATLVSVAAEALTTTPVSMVVGFLPSLCSRATSSGATAHSAETDLTGLNVTSYPATAVVRGVVGDEARQFAVVGGLATVLVGESLPCQGGSDLCPDVVVEGVFHFWPSRVLCSR